MKKNFLITTGGSGGHITPAIIISDHLSSQANIIISTDKRGLKFLNKETHNIEVIDTPKLNNLFILPYNFLLILFLTLKSFLLIKKKRIEKIFSTGGYMSIPLILAARFLNIQLYLIEPNQILGRANRYFLRSCKKIFCYSSDLKNFPDQLKYKIVVINPLVKKSIYELNLPKKNNDKFNILIVGGSQGASIFDKNLKSTIVNISKKKNLKIIHQTSENNISSLREFYKKNNIENKIFSYDLDLLNKMYQADLCITRAGASTLAELSLMNTPFIVVPLPTSKDNHQFENANFYAKNDSCWIIEQKYFDEKIEELLGYIFNDKDDYLNKKENLKRLNFNNSWNNVNQKILETINEN